MNRTLQLITSILTFQLPPGFEALVVALAPHGPPRALIPPLPLVLENLRRFCGNYYEASIEYVLISIAITK